MPKVNRPSRSANDCGLLGPLSAFLTALLLFAFLHGCCEHRQFWKEVQEDQDQAAVQMQNKGF